MSAISVRAARDGFSLVELIVAIVLLGIVLMTLGGLSFRTARMGLDVGNSSARQAVGLAAINHLATIDYDSLASQAGCDTVQVGNAGYQRCIAFDNSVSRVRNQRVTVTVTPLRAGSFPRSFTLIRAQKPRVNPVNLP
jgi:prepilin-type N-terminal cleavage/methylation domain-containing protein